VPEKTSCGNPQPPPRLPRDDEGLLAECQGFAVRRPPRPALDDETKNLSPIAPDVDSSPLRPTAESIGFAEAICAARRATRYAGKMLDFVLGAATTAAPRIAASWNNPCELATSATPTFGNCAAAQRAAGLSDEGMAIPFPCKLSARRSLTSSEMFAIPNRAEPAPPVRTPSGAVQTAPVAKAPLACRRNRRSCASGSAGSRSIDEWATLSKRPTSELLCKLRPRFAAKPVARRRVRRKPAECGRISNW